MKYSVFGIPRAKIFLLEFYLQKPLVRFCSPFVVLRSCFALLSIPAYLEKNYSQQEHSFSDFHNRLLADQHTSFRFAIRDWHPGFDLGLLYLCFPYQNKEIRKEIELDDSHPFYCFFISYNFVFLLPKSRYHQGNADQHQKPNYRGIESATSYESLAMDRLGQSNWPRNASGIRI